MTYDGGYVPVMLQPGWVLEKYWGWSVCEQGDCFKLLRKRRGPITMFLLLSSGASSERIADIARRHGMLGSFSVVVWNDFGSTSAERARDIAGARFMRVTGSRWFGVGTFVVDLTESPATIEKRMAARERTACRRAERVGARIEFCDRPPRRDLQSFLALQLALARRQGFERPPLRVLEAMSEAGSLTLARCRDSESHILVANLIYRQQESAFFLSSARARGAPGWAGAYIQRCAIDHLKAAGLHWYDLGLVSRRDDADGIYRFKSSLGGTFISSGTEYHRVPMGLGVPLAATRGLRDLFRRFV